MNFNDIIDYLLFTYWRAIFDIKCLLHLLFPKVKKWSEYKYKLTEEEKIIREERLLARLTEFVVSVDRAKEQV